MFVGESFSSDEASEDFSHGFGLVETRPEAGALDRGKGKSLDFPNVASNLILTGVFSGDPPLPPVLENGKGKFIFELTNPLFSGEDGDFRVEIA